MKEIILIKNGELALKGLNRSSFEAVLVKNMKRRISELGEFKFIHAQSTIQIEPQSDDIDLDEAVGRLTKVFGVAGLSRAAVADKDMEDILRIAGEYLKDELESVETFKVEAKRADKKFPLKSPEICREVGGYLLEKYPHLTVDVREPQLTVTVEIRDYAAYVRGGQLHGAGGMPVGTSGKGALLISGGIDSPVAGYMMAKRGVELVGVHFASPPYTSERSEQKVADLLQKVSEYSGKITMFTVPFTRIQEEINDKCPEDLSILILRRFMMRAATRIANREKCGALITGESLGQVASQTMKAIECTNDTDGLPVYRPLIGMDKDEIVSISRKIETFDISILPYDDCCTVFVPKHPRTQPKLETVRYEESKLDIDELLEDALKQTTFKHIGGSKHARRENTEEASRLTKI